MENEKKHGALIGSIIIIVILIIGGIYVWQTKVKEIQDENKKATELQNSQNQQNATELNNIDQELNNTNINLDANAANSVE